MPSFRQRRGCRAQLVRRVGQRDERAAAARRTVWRRAERPPQRLLAVRRRTASCSRSDGHGDAARVARLGRDSTARERLPAGARSRRPPPSVLGARRPAATARSRPRPATSRSTASSQATWRSPSTISSSTGSPVASDLRAARRAGSAPDVDARAAPSSRHSVSHRAAVVRVRRAVRGRVHAAEGPAALVLQSPSGGRATARSPRRARRRRSRGPGPSALSLPPSSSASTASLPARQRVARLVRGEPVEASRVRSRSHALPGK